MRNSRLRIRTVAIAVVAFAVLGTTGCKWFSRTNDLYAQSPESRPLEVPPDLDRPSAEGAMALPPAGSVTRSEAGTGAPAAAAASNTSFVVPGEREELFARVGEVLAATDGLTIASRAQILGTYDVAYEGSSFLVRVAPVEGGVQVGAVDPRGLPASSEAAIKLVAALKAALGG